MESISHGLNAVGTLSVITKVEPKRIALFVSDVYRVIESASDYRYNIVLDWIYENIRDTPVPPLEFIEAFEETRRVLLSEKVEITDYIKYLRMGLEEGITKKDMYEYIISYIRNKD